MAQCRLSRGTLTDASKFLGETYVRGDLVTHERHILTGHERSDIALPADCLGLILSFLFEDLVEDLGEKEAVSLTLRLATVSCKFHEAVLSIPSLWEPMDNESYVSDGFHKRLEQCSREVPFIVRLDLQRGSIRRGRYWERLAWRTQYRYGCWTHLNMDVSLNVKNVLKKMMPYTIVEFESLQSASFRFDPSDDCDELLSLWLFPNLTHLELCDGIPYPTQFRGLTSFGLKTRKVGKKRAENFMKKLLIFLRKLDSLRVLSLDVSGVTYPFRMGDLPHISLPSITSLSIYSSSEKPEGLWRRKQNSVLSALFLNDSIKVPSATDYHISLCFSSGNDLFRAANTHYWEDRITSLTLTSTFWCHPGCLSYLLAKFSNLHYLKLDIPGVASTLSAFPTFPKCPVRFVTVDERIKKSKWDWRAGLRRISTDDRNVRVSFFNGKEDPLKDDHKDPIARCTPRFQFFEDPEDEMLCFECFIYFCCCCIYFPLVLVERARDKFGGPRLEEL